MRAIISALFAAGFLATTAQAQTLDRIRETGELKIGYRADAAPLSFTDADGKPAGYAPLVCTHVAQAIANKLQSTDLLATFHPVDATNRFDKVASGEIDLLCGAATITLARRELVDFSTPVYIDGAAILLPAEAETSMEALAGAKLGVRKGTTTEAAMQPSLDEAGITAEIIQYDDHKDGLQAMQAGEIDAYFADQSILFHLAFSGENPGKFQVTSEIMTIEKQGLALQRGDADFRLLVDRVISELYADGTMQDLFTRAMPGVTPGAAMKAMYLTAPILP